MIRDDFRLRSHPLISPLVRRFLAPLGQYAQSKQPSKGKRSKKRKRMMDVDGEPVPHPIIEPPPPELAESVDIGLPSITRSLQETISRQSQLGPESDSESHRRRPYAVIFIARSGYAPAFTSHFPEMVAAASRALPSAFAIRLVGYSKPCADRLRASLGIPRASAVGIRQDAPMSKALVDYVQDCVQPITIPWLQEAETAEYRRTCIASEEKMVPIQRAPQN